MFPKGWAVLLCLLLVPVAVAQDGVREEIASTPGSQITFYGHVYASSRDAPMPMNTQFPDGEDDYSRGATDGPCGAPPPLPDDSQDCEDADFNELYLYTTAGFVQAKSPDAVCGGTTTCDYSLFHNERGQTKDIYFDTSMPANATLHMSADFHGWPGNFATVGFGWNWDPGYYQDWSIQVRVWHASLGDWSTDPSAKPDMGPIAAGEGTLIASGQSEPMDMWSLDPTIPLPQAGQTVWPFTAALEWDPDFVAAGGYVPYLNDLIVEYQWFQDTDGQKYILATPNAGTIWNLNAGEDYPNNIVLPVRNPMDVELVFPRFIHDKLVILSIINTPWGSYDIDPELTRLLILDAAGNEVRIDPATLDAGVDSSVAHSGHYKPINATWVWDYQTQGLPAGDYTARVEVTNFQHSYTTFTDATFTVLNDGSGGTAQAGRSGLQSYTQEDFEAFNQGAGQEVQTDEPEPEAESTGSQESPGVGLLLVAVAVGLAGRLRRRE